MQAEGWAPFGLDMIDQDRSRSSRIDSLPFDPNLTLNLFINMSNHLKPKTSQQDCVTRQRAHGFSRFGGVAGKPHLLQVLGGTEVEDDDEDVSEKEAVSVEFCTPQASMLLGPWPTSRAAAEKALKDLSYRVALLIATSRPHVEKVAGNVELLEFSVQRLDERSIVARPGPGCHAQPALVGGHAADEAHVHRHEAAQGEWK